MHLTKLIYTLLFVMTLFSNEISAYAVVLPKNNYETTIIHTDDDRTDNHIAIIPRGYQDFVYNTAEKEFLELFKWWSTAIVIFTTSLLIICANK